MKQKYFLNASGKYIHKIRGAKHYYNGAYIPGTGRYKYSHTAVKFACYNTGIISKRRRNRVFMIPPPGRPLCHRCFHGESKRP